MWYKVKKVFVWKKGNITDMQWPCPTGYHIPTKDEWQAVYDAWVSLWVWTVSDSDNMKIYLKLPYSWRRLNASAEVNTQWIRWQYWSSSWYSNEQSYMLSIATWENISPQGKNYQSLWLAIRPFKDTPVTPDSTWSELYTNWIYHNSTLWLISIKNWNNWITIADKNLWATVVYNNWDTLSQNNCWKYYQRGNNYWFAWTWSVTTSSSQVNAGSYWPWNYYGSTTFITRSSSPWNWDSSNNANLRWGETWPFKEYQVYHAAV